MSTDANPAESSPAAEVAAPSLERLSDADRQTWRKTGSLPDVSAASSAAAPVEQVSSTDEQTAPASEPGTPAKPEKKNAESRIKELLADRHARDARIAELEARLATPQAPDVKAAPSPAPVKFPNYDDWRDQQPADQAILYEDYIDERVKFLYQAEQQVERQRVEKLTAEQQKTERIAKYRETAESFVAERPDYWDVVRPITQAAMPEGIQAVMEDAIDGSANSPRLLYHLGQNPELFQRLISLPERLAAWELGKLEASLGQPASPVVKTLSTAPAPPPTLGSRPAQPADDVESAVKRQDFATFKLAANRRQIGANR